MDTLTEGRSSETGLQRLRHGQVAAVGQRRLHQLILHAQILEAVVELGVGHLDGQLLEHVGLLGVEVEAHLAEPLEGFGVIDLVLDQSSAHVSLVDQLGDLRIKTRKSRTRLQLQMIRQSSRFNSSY